MSACEWPWATLDQVATVTAGNPAPQGAEFFEGGSRPFVRVQDLGRLNGAAHLTETTDFVNDRAAATLKLFPKGSVLFTKSGASLLLNQRAILGRDMHVVSHIGVAVPGPRITSEWLYYWLRTVDFADIAHGANMPSLPLARVKQVRVPLPPVPEQWQRVAEIEKQFSRLDEAVANLRWVKANLKRYKAAVLKAAVAGQLAPKTSNWQRVELGTVAAVIDPQPSHRTPPVDPGGVPYVGLGDFREDDTIDLQNARKVSPRVLEEHRARYRLNVGDFVFGKIGTIGRPARLPTPFNYALSANLVLIQPDDSRIAPGFAFVVMSSPQIIAASVEAKSATTQAAFGIKRIRQLTLQLPSPVEQRDIVAEVDQRVSIVREVDSEVAANMKRAQALRQAVLTQAFVAHQAKDDQVAS